jgi:adenine-specific DNA-methyltransferase
VLFEERVFPGVLEEVVLLLAEGHGPTDHVELHEARGLEDLRNPEALGSAWTPLDMEGKWTLALLPRDALEAYVSITSSDDFAVLHDWGETSLGMVTGNNQYFTLASETAARLRIPPEELLPISPPDSRHLRELTFNRRKWEELSRTASRVYLLYPNADRPSRGAQRYIKEGEDLGFIVHTSAASETRGGASLLWLSLISC